MNKTKTIYLCIVILFSWASNVVSQTDTINKSKPGKVEIIQDYKISDLVQKHKDLNAKSLIKGYRVKIHFGNDKTEAAEIKGKFIEKYPEVSAYIRYDQPYFSVRVGDFRTKLEAFKFLKEIQSEYPGAFLVQDDIERSK